MQAQRALVGSLPEVVFVCLSAGPAPPVRLVRFQLDHFFSPSALTADLGDYDVRGSIDKVRKVLS